MTPDKKMKSKKKLEAEKRKKKLTVPQSFKLESKRRAALRGPCQHGHTEATDCNSSCF